VGGNASGEVRRGGYPLLRTASKFKVPLQGGSKPLGEVTPSAFPSRGKENKLRKTLKMGEGYEAIGPGAT